jgi:hypothetical protein
MPISSGTGVPGQGINGTWTRCFSRSVVNGTICGGRSTKCAVLEPASALGNLFLDFIPIKHVFS